eukprot:scpid83345/ scgid31585/ 
MTNACGCQHNISLQRYYTAQRRVHTCKSTVNSMPQVHCEETPDDDDIVTLHRRYASVQATLGDDITRHTTYESVQVAIDNDIVERKHADRCRRMTSAHCTTPMKVCKVLQSRWHYYYSAQSPAAVYWYSTPLPSSRESCVTFWP